MGNQRNSAGSPWLRLPIPLHPDDVAQARRVTLEWAESQTTVARSPEVFGDQASLELNTVLNEIVLQRGRTIFEHESPEVSSELTDALRNYLERLTVSASRELWAAMAYRVAAEDIGLVHIPGDKIAALRSTELMSSMESAGSPARMYDVAFSFIVQDMAVSGDTSLPDVFIHAYGEKARDVGRKAVDDASDIWLMGDVSDAVEVAIHEWLAETRPAYEDVEEQLWDVALDAAMVEVERRRVQSRLEVMVSDPPAPQPFGISHEGAEALAAAWMRHLGESDAAVTRYSGDGGIDVVGSRFVAQVKNYTGTVPTKDVRELWGAASVEGKRGLFFTTNPYPAGAISFADRAGIGLFIYDAVAGTLTGANQIGVRFRESGLTT